MEAELKKTEYRVRTLLDITTYCFENAINYTVFTHLGTVTAKFFDWNMTRGFILFITNDHYNDWEIVSVNEYEVKVSRSD